MIRKINEGMLKGFGFIQIGKTRELINLTWSEIGFIRAPEFGFTCLVNRGDGLFLGFTFWKTSVWLQVLGETIEVIDNFEGV